MPFTRIVRLFYAGYSVYTLLIISCTTIELTTILPALVILWSNYFALWVGYNFTGSKESTAGHFSKLHAVGWLSKRSYTSLFALSLVSLTASFFVVKFYTGQTPFTTFESLTNNISLYNQYQKYFKEQGIKVFSFEKLPFIFMMFYVKFMVFYSYLTFLSSSVRISAFLKFYLFIITISFVYIGLTRGTSFEFFELVVLTIYIILIRQNYMGAVSLKSVFTALFVICAMFFIFYLGVTARGVNFNFYISNDILYDPEGFIPQTAPFLAFLTVFIFNYFGFGFYYLSIYLDKIWFSSLDGVLGGLIPFGNFALSNPPLQEQMRATIDMGVRWHPDAAILIHNFGYLGLLTFCFLIGAICRYAQKFKAKTPMVQITTFAALLQMISLPVGSFLLTSSASRLIVLTLLSYWIWRIFVACFLHRTYAVGHDGNRI